MKRKRINRIAAVLLGAATVFSVVGCAGASSVSGSGSAAAGVLAKYPKPVAEKMSAQEFMEGDGHWDWWSSYREMLSTSASTDQSVNTYYSNLMKNVLVSEDKNTVCSPVNTFIAMAMLAEITDGNTRQQVLDMLGAKDMESLRETASAVWNCNYVDTPMLKSILANGVWLDSDTKYNEKTLKTLAEKYYVSSFVGEMGSDEMNQSLRDWTDENTKGLLSEYTKEMKIDPSAILELVSTIYYKAMWSSEFNADSTTQETFHGALADTTVDMMHSSESTSVYQSDKFMALGRYLTDSGNMYFILPNEGVNVNDVVTDPAVFNVINSGEDGDGWSYPMVHLSVPKFKVSAKQDLVDTFKALGVTDAFDAAKSDFSPLTTDQTDLFVSKIDHAAYVEIDEHGVTGAAYTDMQLCGTGMPEEEIDFVIDRPFMFIVTGADGSILFSGVVKNIE